ncbi:MAG: hypothetical protein LJF04_00500 [Gemmatimonadetes bacterium]|nr:hypothetical protein [Gemmatimonadota bacterium]
MRKRLIHGLLVSAALAIAACETGPSGPGVLPGTVSAAPPQTLGAVVLEVTGSGIEGFEGQAGSRAYGAMVSAANKRYRVVVVGTGQLGFGVKVDDIGGPKPTIEVVSAVDADNTAMSISGMRVSF